MIEIVLNSPLDMHLHLRQGDMLRKILPYTVKHFSGALVMPNTESIIDSFDKVKQYEDEILRNKFSDKFCPYMTLYYQTHYTREFLEEVKSNILAIKFYPKNLTTNSQHGCDPKDADKVLEIMEDLDIPLCVHAESEGYHEDREYLFHNNIQRWTNMYSKLKIIIEHISDGRTLKLIRDNENIYGTVTPHHLLLTGDDIMGPPLNPHNYCMPVCKRPGDRDLLKHVILNHNEKLMLGTDSAPHMKNAKEQGGCAGIFNAPIALQLLAEVFFKDLDKIIDGQFRFRVNMGMLLEDFVSNNAQRIYGIKPPNKQITLIEKPFTIPNDYDGIVPLWAGKTIEWSVKDE
jgi:dihydroorotase